MSSRILPAPIVHTLIEIKSIHNLTYNEVKIEYNLHIPNARDHQ